MRREQHVQMLISQRQHSLMSGQGAFTRGASDHALAPTEENVDILMLGGKCSSNEQTQLQGSDVITLKVRKRKNLSEITAIVIFNVTR